MEISMVRVLAQNNNSFRQTRTNANTTAGGGLEFSIDPVGVVTLALILALLGVTLFFLAKRFAHSVKAAAWERMSVKSTIFEVRLPQSNEIEIQAADQMYSGLSGIAGKVGRLKRWFSARNFISWEIVAFPENIRFYVVCPNKIANLVEKQVNAAFPDAEIIPAKDYNVFPEGSKVSFASMKLAEDAYKPLRTYEELNTDSMSVITSSMSKLKKGEAMVYQLVITPAGTDWRNEGKKFVNKVRENNSDPEKSKIDVPDDVLSAIEQKTEKIGFLADLRIVAVAKSKDDADTNLQGMLSALDQFRKEGVQQLKKSNDKDILKPNNSVRDFVYRIPKEGLILNTAELSTLFHFPNQTVKTPHINWLLSKRAPAGPEIEAKYTEGAVHLANSVFRDTEKKVYLKLNDRRRHMYIVGKTGAGKTNFLQRMILQDIYNGHGLAFLDPHGDACEHILERIPPERAEDVIYFNPADTERPVGFNIMEFKNENEKYRIVESFLGLLNKMFDPHNQGITGPRFQQAVRNGMLTAMYKDGASLVETVRIITDENYVKEYMPLITDDVVKRYWTDQVANTQDFHKSEILGHVTSKFEKFVTNKQMRNMIGQSKSGFDIRDVMDNQKILLVNLSKGLIGEENSQFLGLLFVPRLLNAAMQRADIAEKDRKDFFLYVDEFQNFATNDFAQILSEARKYRLNLVVANQYIAQIDEQVRDAVFGNVGTIISFKVGVNDASYLQNEFDPVFTQNDLINLENYNIYCKMLVDGEYPSPFSAKIPYDPEKFPENGEVSKTIRELSRLRYGRDKNIVEAEIGKRAGLSTGDNASLDKKGGAGGFGAPGGFQTPLKAADD
ncbi:MAG: type IV secretory system conjugative DNA transfer family protein [Candidatus Dojkabacteria bacterium]